MLGMTCNFTNHIRLLKNIKALITCTCELVQSDKVHFFHMMPPMLSIPCVLKRLIQLSLTEESYSFKFEQIYIINDEYLYL